jgi:hypothetical protein
MPAQYTKSISFGSHEDVGGKREKLYIKAAKKMADGNLSRLICQIVDKALGITLPLPGIGRPSTVERTVGATKSATKTSKTMRGI